MMADWLPYERGAIVSDTRDDHAKLREAWSVVRDRLDAGLPVVNLTGLERVLVTEGVDPGLLDDELAPALFGERFRELALEHLGGDPNTDEAFLANRTTAGIVATMQTVVPEGGVVVGVSAGYSHPAVVRSVRLAGGRLVDVRRRLRRMQGVAIEAVAQFWRQLRQLPHGGDEPIAVTGDGDDVVVLVGALPERPAQR